MATYKVIQDIEAEDKLIGPLTLRQFIYAGIAAICLYLSFLVITRGAAFLLVIFLPVGGICGFFAFPFKQDQPTELWALAKIRFMFKPHRRIWNQSGVKELVTVTAPKKMEFSYTDGLSQIEVKSRLRALADTIDTRGWAVKNVNVSMYNHPQPGVDEVVNSDRLVGPAGLPQDVPALDIQAADDILDEQSNPVAQHFNQMIQASSSAHRQQITSELRQQADDIHNNTAANTQSQALPNNYWFLNQPAASAIPANQTMFDSLVVPPSGSDNAGSLPGTNSDDQTLSARLRAQHDRPDISAAHLRTVQPLVAQSTASGQPANAPVTATPNPAIVKLAKDNDKNIATLARLANPKPPEGNSPDEVVISLH
jgi:hypothetical protein